MSEYPWKLRSDSEAAALDPILRSLPRCATEISLGVADEDNDPGFLQLLTWGNCILSGLVSPAAL